MDEELFYKTHKMSLEYVRKLIQDNPFKAFAIIHSNLHHQMKFILRFGFQVKNEKHAPLKWGIVSKKHFEEITNLLFIVGKIDFTLRQKLIQFNEQRNKIIGHIDVYKQSDITENTLLRACDRGLLLLKELDKLIHDCFFPSKK